MAQPLVSVVIPVYNVEAYLDRCVASVVNQTYPNLEIILVDDGSPDRCPAMCDEWAEKDGRIRVIHKQNAGQGLARNSGMEAACGKYIFFFDSDDYVDPTIVEKCVASAEAYHSDAVAFGRWDVFEDGRKESLPIRAQKQLFVGEEIRTDFLPKLFTYEIGLGVGACGRMYRLQTIAENGVRFISEREMTSEDAYLALEFFSHASVVSIIPEPLYFYLKRSDSFSRTYMKERQEKNDKFLKKCLSYIVQAGLPEQVASHLKVRYHFYTIAAMKQVLASDLRGAEGRKALWEIFHSPLLRQTLTPDVLKLEKRSQQLFFTFLKLRCYWMCFLLLELKMRKS